MVDNNQNLQRHSAFYWVMQMTYSHSTLMYIRRQVSRNDKSVSLIMLTDDILENCSLITKEFYSSLYVLNKHVEEHEEWKRLGERNFVEYFGEPLGDSLNPQIIEQHIQDLEKVRADSLGFTDRRLAHLDRREAISIPTHSEIESWCQVLNGILKKYMLLLRAIDYEIEPKLQHDWKCIFRVPWL